MWQGADALGYLQSKVSELGESKVKQLLSVEKSPLVQAYLKYAGKPESRRLNQGFMKSIVRVLKAQTRLADELEASGKVAEAAQARIEAEKSVLAFSELMGNMKVMNAQALGNWEKASVGAGRVIWVPRALLVSGGAGTFGVYADTANKFPVKLDLEKLERHRRSLFKSTAQAA